MDDHMNDPNHATYDYIHSMAIRWLDYDTTLLQGAEVKRTVGAYIYIYI